MLTFYSNSSAFFYFPCPYPSPNLTRVRDFLEGTSKIRPSWPHASPKSLLRPTGAGWSEKGAFFGREMGFPCVDWEEESYPTYGDFVALPVFFVFFPIARLLLDRIVFERLARCFGCERKNLVKFKESAWKFVYFLSAEILALTVTYKEPWFRNTKYFWVGPGDLVWPEQKMKLKLKGLYMYSGGFYSYSIFALMFWETRRSDFAISMSHHVGSVILIVLSYIFRFARVGSVVLALHDASDVYLETGKMSRYCGLQWLANIAFDAFAISWFVLRLVYYPFWILSSTSYEITVFLDKEKHKIEGPVYYYVFNTLLFFLLVIHIYWWVLMLRVLKKQIQDKGQVGDDVRSDSEDEDEEHKHRD